MTIPVTITETGDAEWRAEPTNGIIEPQEALRITINHGDSPKTVTMRLDNVDGTMVLAKVQLTEFIIAMQTLMMIAVNNP